MEKYMKTIKELSAYYYIGLVIGYYVKQDVIDWADRVINKGGFPYELIEVSLSGNKPIEDTASILKRIYGEERIFDPLYKLIGELVMDLEEKRITDDDFFSYILRLYLQGNTFILDEELSYLLDQLSDGYYLATEGIYGNTNSIRDEAIQHLSKYKEYVRIFE